MWSLPAHLQLDHEYRLILRGWPALLLLWQTVEFRRLVPVSIVAVVYLVVVSSSPLQCTASLSGLAILLSRTAGISLSMLVRQLNFLAPTCRCEDDPVAESFVCSARQGPASKMLLRVLK